MDREKLGRAKDIDYMCYLLDSIKQNCSEKGGYWNDLYYLCGLNKEFKTALYKLIYETKNKLEKEFNKL